ncbi:MAG: thiamine phosphate synthase [Deltaproteobacteria bacterium CG11_big_fil_rev_8_21_14_0_20_47_16]|nr:MAG: thiamine phosphate synthase [Deltaproteobacteria bacterium CG11_big_fil_rev_8_21_14_0_20_47_16]
MASSKLFPQGLYVIVDPRFLPHGVDLLDYVSELAHARAPIIQLRMKDASASQVLEVARRMIKIRRKHKFFFVVNDYPEIAKEVGADAVHVGKTDAAIRDARAVVGPDMMIGFSSHSLSEAVAAAEKGADYVALGAIYPTATKGPGHPVQGLETLRQVVAAVSKPVVAIGGINRTNAADVRACGPAAIAMITGISQAEDVAAEVRWYQSLR